MGRPRLSAVTALYLAVVVGFTFAAARVWWLSRIVPGMDYPQFLVFVRAVQDMGDPSSPFHGTYTTGPWLVPTALPVHLTGIIARWLGGSSGSIEDAGKVLLTAQNVGLVAAGMFLLRQLGRPRWAVVLLFPLVHSRWGVGGGYFAYASSITLVVLGWGLTVRWLRRLDAVSGFAIAACLCATLFWHGIGFAVLALGFAVLWLLWRAPSIRARWLSVLPVLPCVAQFVMWIAATFAPRLGDAPPTVWMTVPEAADAMVDNVWAVVPHAGGFVLVLAGIVGLGLVADWQAQTPAHAAARAWRVGNPFLVVCVAYLLAYFFMPMHWSHVEGIASRFAYPAVLAFVFAWNLPASRAKRAVLVACVLLFSAYSLRDLTRRFHGFEADTRGASDLIDMVARYETLFCAPADGGASKDFKAGAPILREIEQYATIRHGGLPNSSFAGYGYNYVRYVDGRNPMPGLKGLPASAPELSKFDYVLAREGQWPRGDRFPLVDKAGGWELYGVCGSARFPDCSH